MSQYHLRATDGLWDGLVLAGVAWLFLTYFPLEVLVQPTQVVGGDATAHYYYAWYLRHVTLPQGILCAWSNDLLMGYPVLQYYFPFPFLAAAILGFAIPFPVAFKLMIVGSMLAVPLACYAYGRLVGIPFPGPALAALMAVGLMFTEYNHHMGFYVLDNLSGQFSSTLAIALLLVTLGLSYRCVQTQTPRWTVGLWLAAALLSHTMLIPLFVVLHTVVWILRERERARVLRLLWPALGVGFALFAYWALPFLFDTDFAVSPKIPKAITPQFYGKFVNSLVIALHVLAAQGGWQIIRTREPVGLYILQGALCAGGLVLLSMGAEYVGNLPVLDRYWPLYLLFVSLLASYAASMLSGRVLSKHLKRVVAIGAAAVTVLSILASSRTIAGQARWNFSGLETKAPYAALKELTQYVASLPGEDRVSVSLLYDSKIAGQLGGPFIWDILPMFIRKPVLATGTQGFYSLSFAAVNAYLYDGLLTRKPEPLDRLSEIFNVRYVLKSSATQTEPLEPHFRLLRDIPITPSESFQVFERTQSQWHYVAIPPFAPIRYDGSETKRELIERVYKRAETAEVPLVLSRVFDGPRTTSLEQLPRVPVSQTCTITEQVEQARIRFTTSCPHQPHVVRISYHPGWTSQTGEPLYQVTPNFILLSPRRHRVELVYGPTWAGQLGQLLGLLGLATVVSWWGSSRVTRSSGGTYGTSRAPTR